MASLSELIAGGDAAHPVPGWMTALGGPSGFTERPLMPPATRPSADPAGPDAGAGHERALAEAHARGMAEARAACEAERAAHEAARGGLALAFAQLDQAARLALRQQLTETVAALCEQVIEPALIDHGALEQRCTALAEALGEAPAACTLHLHPDDLALLSSATRERWSVRTDPALARGSLRLEGGEGVVADGPDEWRRAIAAALGA